MRIAVISDIHSNLVAFEAVIADLKTASPDAIVYLGDLVMKGPQPRECIELLRSLEPTHIVRGNYDHMFTRFPRPGWEPKNNKESVIAEDFSITGRSSPNPIKRGSPTYRPRPRSLSTALNLNFTTPRPIPSIR